jgi:hypothetical protein
VSRGYALRLGACSLPLSSSFVPTARSLRLLSTPSFGLHRHLFVLRLRCVCGSEVADQMKIREKQIVRTDEHGDVELAPQEGNMKRPRVRIARDATSDNDAIEPALKAVG